MLAARLHLSELANTVNFKRRRALKNQSGQALIISLVGIALFAILAGAIASRLTSTSRETAKGGDRANLESFVTALGSVVNDQVGCFGTNVHAPRVVPADPTSTADLQGLRFYGQVASGLPTGVPNQFKFMPNLATQWVVLGTHFIGSGGQRLDAANGTDLIAAGIRVEKRYLNSVLNTGAGAYSADLMLVASSLRSGETFAPRVISTITLNAVLFVAPNYQLNSCQGQVVASATCAQMGCTFHPGVSGGFSKCMCGYPDGVCPVDGLGDQQYLTGYNQVLHQPICHSIRFQCASGLFFAGFDQSGLPICFAVEN